MVSNTLDDYFWGKIAQKVFESKIKAHPANAGLSNWLSNISFICKSICDRFCCQLWFRIISKPFKIKLCSLTSEVDVLFDWNLSRQWQTPFSRTGRWFRSAALHRICNLRIHSYAIFLIRDQWMIKRLRNAMSTALVGNEFSRNPSHFTWEKSVVNDWSSIAKEW